MSAITQSAADTISRLRARLSGRQGIRQSGIGRKVVGGANVLKKDHQNLILGVLLLGLAGVGGYFLFKNFSNK